MRPTPKLGQATLEISLTRGDISPAPGDMGINHFRGGRDTLLRWIETQLGLQRLPTPQAIRIAAYALMLNKAGGSTYAASLNNDAWSTATALLRRRDELLLAGWDKKSNNKLPPLLRDLAKVEAINTALAPCEAERISLIEKSFEDGQTLPEHEIYLSENPDVWPRAWRPILAKLAIRSIEAEAVKPAAKKGTVLYDFQKRLLEKNPENESIDDSLSWWRALSTFTAVDAVAASLSMLKVASGTVILCEDAGTAALLDDALVRRGVPPMGVIRSTSAHPVIQILPLWLSLSWDPIDPSQLLDFLNLPVSPLPRFAARLLAEAVATQPGIGGREWNKALTKIAESEYAGKETAIERLNALRDGGLVQRGEGLPQKLIAQRCTFLSKWAGGYAAHVDEDKPDLATSLRISCSQANTLRILVAALPGPITEPQLQRLLASVQENGVDMTRRPAALNGPRWITSLAELIEPCERLIWLGVHTGDLPSSPWTAQEKTCLQACGMDMDFDRRLHLMRRDAERHGMLKVSHNLLAVEIAASGAARSHPVWLHGSSSLGRRNPESLEDLLETDGKQKAWPLPTEKKKPSASRTSRNIWEIPTRYLADRNTTSAGDLEARLGCPLKWVLQYIAKLYPSSVERLPEEFQLKGNFAHALIEEVFAKSPASREKAAAQAVALFDSRVAVEAATLAQPGAIQAKLEFRNALARAAGAFFDLLRRGNYQIVGFEFTPETKLFDKKFTGRLDCLLKDAKGQKAVIDLKYSGKKYSDLIEDGQAIQLAVYAAAAAAAPGKAPVAAGYFIIDRAQLWTPESSPVTGAEGSELLEGPSMAETWSAFSTAIKAADDWLKSGRVPVRPLQPPEEWPAGADIALRDISKQRNSTVTFSVCQYCNYARLCGLQETV